MYFEENVDIIRKYKRRKCVRNCVDEITSLVVLCHTNSRTYTYVRTYTRIYTATQFNKIGGKGLDEGANTFFLRQPVLKFN